MTGEPFVPEVPLGSVGRLASISSALIGLPVPSTISAPTNPIHLTAPVTLEDSRVLLLNMAAARGQARFSEQRPDLTSTVTGLAIVYAVYRLRKEPAVSTPADVRQELVDTIRRFVEREVVPVAST